jgi:molybdopterin molybdotransferase
VSVGEEDHVKPAVQAEGRLDLWLVAMKPGKPVAFGRVNDPAGGRARPSSACPATRCRASSPS